MILPLFARELTERAARRRTYATRAVFGAVLYAVFLITVYRTIEKAGGEGNSFAVLGTGRQLYERLVGFLCWSVLLFQPALMAGGITYEKERESLSLLMLTGMSPGKILVEKFLAGLLPMASLLLLALPLGAITMSYGGVSVPLLFAGIGVVFAALLHAGALAILCSAWCRTTTGAILAAYVGIVVVQFAPVVAASASQFFAEEGAETPGWALAIWPPAAFERVLNFQNAASTSAAQPTEMLRATLQSCNLLLGTALIFLLLGRLCIERRAMTPVVAQRGARRVARKLGRIGLWWRRMWPLRRDLPGDEPVAWRESGRGILGGRVRFAKLTIGLSLATLFLCVGLFMIHPRTDGPARIQILAMVTGTIAVLVLVTRSIGSLLDERTNQTLDILLTTRLGAGAILKEKVDALTRYRVLFWLLLAIVFAAQGWAEFSYVRANMTAQGLAQFWLCGTLAATIYPSLIIWLSMFIALWLRSKARAVACAVCVVAVWFVAPLVILDFSYIDRHASNSALWFSLISPLGILDANANDLLAHFSTDAMRAGRTITTTGSPGSPVAFNFGFYSVLTVLLRWLCLALAERWLRTFRR